MLNKPILDDIDLSDLSKILQKELDVKFRKVVPFWNESSLKISDKLWIPPNYHI